ncbi:MAG: polysaccharide biosynthesis protein [Anaerolineales bacterium]|nr:polysaccharide biosynthesis protein [Anaerolineales bacterium]MCB9172756.1 polysaccharide biosynthesis protein [Ardenticatenales bacterium]
MYSIRNRHLLIVDILALTAASYLAFTLRLERLNLGMHWDDWALFTFLASSITLPIFMLARLYSQFWRYASVNELLRLVGTTTLATMITAIVALGATSLSGTFSSPRTVPIIFLPFAVALIAMPRLAVRLFAQLQRRGQPTKIKPILIVGAGDAGAMILREMRNNAILGYDVVGIVDDDPRKQNVRIFGVPVRGTREDIARLVRSYRIQEVIIAMPSAPGDVIRDVVQRCEAVNVRTRIIPAIGRLIDGSVSVSQLRRVEIEDLLRRDPIRTNTEEIRGLLNGKRVLVTGAGGSIGAELCRQIVHSAPDHLLLIGHGENSIFAIANELKQSFPTLALDYRIADIRDRGRLDALYREFRPNVIFHAAAHKHVGLMELNPAEAITNNVMGSQNVVELAAAHRVAHFVMISTDKAVNPTNVMGASKRCAEMVVHRVAQQSGLPYVAVRFGNVLGSNGSVVPIFKRQIAAGGPVTVTHPDMTRYFMTIPEAVQLVLQAASLGRGKEVFVLDMGEPVRIQDMARDLIELSGLQPDEDVKIIFTGTKAGEKLFEELFIPGESYQRTKHEKIFVVQSATNDQISGRTMQLIQRLIAAAHRNDEAVIRLLLKEIVPEYAPTAAVAAPATVTTAALSPPASESTTPASTSQLQSAL